MAANCGAAVGSQILRADDAPKYRRGFKVSVALVSFGFVFPSPFLPSLRHLTFSPLVDSLAVAIFQHIQYRLSNARLAREREALGVDAEKADRGLASVRKPYII
jgi:hypothetical protein